MKKLSQAEVHYAAVALHSNQACWTCKFFIPSGSLYAACQLVTGTISPSGWCDRFTAATVADFAGRPKVPGSLLRGPARNPLLPKSEWHKQDLRVEMSPFPAWRWEVVLPDGRSVQRFKTDVALQQWLDRHGYEYKKGKAS